MRIIVGTLCVAIGGLLYVGQAISVANLSLAQRLGLQERPDHADRLFTVLEIRTAAWDLLSLWTLPLAGVFMLMDHSWWPYMAIVGGAFWLDTAGREGSKWLGLRQLGVRLGSGGGRLTYWGGVALIFAIGALALGVGLAEVV